MTVTSTGSAPTPFGYAGQHGYQTDSVTGLRRLGHHYYDASVGRFISRDPIQDGDNWYTYCDNDPINRVDPSGLIAIVDDIVVGIVVIVIIIIVWPRPDPGPLPSLGDMWEDFKDLIKGKSRYDNDDFWGKPAPDDPRIGGPKEPYEPGKNNKLPTDDEYDKYGKEHPYPNEDDKSHRVGRERIEDLPPFPRRYIKTWFIPRLFEKHGGDLLPPC